MGNGISDPDGDAETPMPIIGDQSMEKHVVKVEVMMDRGDWWATVHGVTKSQT